MREPDAKAPGSQFLQSCLYGGAAAAEETDEPENRKDHDSNPEQMNQSARCMEEQPKDEQNDCGND